jgi:hypothetical protein
MEDEDKEYSTYGRKPEGKRPLGRSKCRWEDNIKMDLGLEEHGLD